MSRRARLVIAAAVAVISLTGIVVLAIRLATHGSDRASLPAAYRERPAQPPFTGYRETRVDLDGRCRRVAVADTAALREQGLRGHGDLGRYAGMLFVNGADTDTPFTMAGVRRPLEISWYTARGARVDGTHLVLCPDRDEARCPAYRSGRRYRLALETPAGSSVAGALAPCG